MIRVVICDNQDIVREGLQLILETDPSIQVIGLARDGAEAVEMVDQLKPNLVLMDLKMPVMSGIQATQIIKDRYGTAVYVLVLTTYDDDESVFDAIRSGAAGYLLKDSPREMLIQAVKQTVEGKTYIDPSVAGKLLTHIANRGVTPNTALAASLNDREKEVLTWLTRGLSNTEIGQRLFLSEGTVRNHITTIFSKLEVNDRTQAAVKALRYGLVSLHDTN